MALFLFQNLRLAEMEGFSFDGCRSQYGECGLLQRDGAYDTILTPLRGVVKDVRFLLRPPPIRVHYQQPQDRHIERVQIEAPGVHPLFPDPGEPWRFENDFLAVTALIEPFQSKGRLCAGSLFLVPRLPSALPEKRGQRLFTHARVSGAPSVRSVDGARHREAYAPGCIDGDGDILVDVRQHRVDSASQLEVAVEEIYPVPAVDLLYARFRRVNHNRLGLREELYQGAGELLFVSSPAVRQQPRAGNELDVAFRRS